MARKYTGVEVPPLSIVDISDITRKARESLGLEGVWQLDVAGVLEHKLHNWGLDFEVCDDLGSKEAESFPDKNLIKIRSDVYDGLFVDDGRSRFTVCHEFGHMAMHGELSLNRKKTVKDTPCFKDSEWQADTFASFMLMPTELMKKLIMDGANSASEVVDAFCVSNAAAEARLRIFDKRGI